VVLNRWWQRRLGPPCIPPGNTRSCRGGGASCTQASIKIDRAALERELANILGRPVNQRVTFDIGFDMTTPGGRRWWSTLQLLLDTIADPGPTPDSAVAAQVSYLERSLIVGLLSHQRHSMTESMRRDVRGADNPIAVRRVLDLVAATPGAQYTIADLARAAGVGARQLQKLFQSRFDMSPSEYVRNIRLDGARADLSRREPGSTVSDIAFRWGFNHLGRFARYYEIKFGEMPSQTLGLRQF
jgi:AraC-like DNA-binding protein